MKRFLFSILSALLIHAIGFAQTGVASFDNAYRNEMKAENTALTERIKAESEKFQQLNTEAGSYMRTQNYNAALQTALKMEGLSPKNADVKHFKGKLYAALNKYAEAIESFDSAIKLNANNKWFYLNKATVQADNNRVQDALETIGLLIKKYPQWSIGYNLKAAFLHSLDKDKEALEAYGDAIKTKPESAQVLTNRGNLYLELGQKEKAKADYKKALAIQPDYAGAIEALEKMN